MNNQQDREGDKFIRQFIHFVSKGYIYYALFIFASAVCLLLISLMEGSIFNFGSIFIYKLTAIFSTLSLISAILMYFKTNIPDAYYQGRLFKNILKCLRYLVILLLISSCIFALFMCIYMVLYFYSPVVSKVSEDLIIIISGILSPFIAIFSYIGSFMAQDKNKINYLLLPVVSIVFVVSIILGIV